MNRKFYAGLTILILVMVGVLAVLLMRDTDTEPIIVYKPPAQEVLDNIGEKLKTTKQPTTDDPQQTPDVDDISEKPPSGNKAYKEWLKSYISKYGENPPGPDDDWVHFIDPVNGRVSKLYDGIVAVTQYDVVTGFAPNPQQLQEYIKLSSKLVAAQKNGNDTLAKNIRYDISILKENAQGEVPKIRGGTYKSSGPPLSPEEYAKQIKIAERQLFKQYEIEHLYGVLY